LGKKQRRNAHAFTEHPADVFQLHPSENEPGKEEGLIQLLDMPYQQELPVNCIERAEVREVISSLNPKKLSGYNLIIDLFLKNCLV
jgi:hypothetical protein